MRRLIKKISGIRQKENLDLSQSTSDERQIGLKIVYEGRNSRVDIVAIHGDGGHYQQSWTHPENQVFWLQDILPTVIPDSRILSFGYQASKSRFVSAENIALGLLDELFRLRSGDDGSTTEAKRPIIFLAHSFGVLLLKGVLATSSLLEDSVITASTRGIIFFGSPPNISDQLQGLLSMIQTAAPESASLVAMKKDLTWLQMTESLYGNLERQGGFKVFYFLEETGKALPVDNEHETVLQMRKTHGMMIRFLDVKDEDFCKVIVCIKRIMGIYNIK